MILHSAARTHGPSRVFAGSGSQSVTKCDGEGRRGKGTSFFIAWFGHLTVDHGSISR